ncbi:response regulator [Leptospira interrogans]|uniref:Signal receiver component of two-component system n=13 Tax=Leptospira interrogans TaxID=173 RepID=Q8F2E2_LEPIN|nr:MULTISPECIES: response regulator [Leptospira]EMF44163.1 response regulator receiver domain protein [Leptospira interrogans serovar Lora str. TE 1992]EMF73833.1 response regulator receiver domain protein [Leptospira interrogans serovar Canicola str. LT1962]EMP04643.1 response regulator receiver domain protein [Leptospira interrogans serovar Pyrogenes str. 200701872]EMY04424.1 response regulator receiver domain protein [Leptospira interrogans str. 2002000626]KAA1267620.1 response regulator [L
MKAEIKNQKTIHILVAEDDPDDRLLMKDGFRENNLANPLHFVKDGEELFEFLQNEGEYSDILKYPKPGIILLDLNMPRMDGREALKTIKSIPELKKIPVIVLTTSREEEDMFKTYDLGANSFIRKPVEFEAFLETIRALGKYWLEIVELPVV